MSFLSGSFSTGELDSGSGMMGKEAKTRSRKALVPYERIASAIYLLRGHKVMLDRDLAALYGVETKRLKEQVRRNIDRFPADFMFVLTKEELAEWRSQFATSNSDRMGLRHPPMVFTEQGVAMLSGVLHSPRAVEVNVAIMRTFVRLREFLASQAEQGKKLRELEKAVAKHSEGIAILFEAIRELTSERPPAIGFQVHTGEDADGEIRTVRERRASYRTKPKRKKGKR